MSELAIRSIIPPPWPSLAPLIDESEREGFRFLVRLRAEFEDGSNRFDAPGEALLGGYWSGELIAVGGLNRDSYAADPRIGRLRHLYVGRAFRGRGVGRALVEALAAAARPHFDVLRLRTDTDAAARFYEAVGFVRAASPDATHRRPIRTRMRKSIPAANSDAYVAALDGWRRARVEELRAAVLGAAPLDEVIRWGHLVYFSNGPVLLIRAEEERVLFGFWRGQRLRSIEPRLKPGGKYEMARLELVEGTSIDPETVRRLTEEAVALNAAQGDPTLDVRRS
jgi:GNAT superfamily N-acetyltransferase